VIKANPEVLAKRRIVQLLPEHHLFHEMQDIHHLIGRRAYQLFVDGGFTHGHDLDDWLKAERGLLHPAPLELRETDSQFSLRVELPGFRDNEIIVAVEPQRVIISAEHEADAEQKKEKMLYSEWRFNRVFRSLRLPAPIDSRRATRRMSDGVLEVKLPKSAGRKSGCLAA